MSDIKKNKPQGATHYAEYEGNIIYFMNTKYGFRLLKDNLIQFDSSLAQQSEFTLLSLGLILAFGSIFSFGFAYLSIRLYPLHKERVLQIQADIAKVHLNS